MTVASLIATLLLADLAVATPPREAVVTVAVENRYGSADDTANVVSQATLRPLVMAPLASRVPALREDRLDDPYWAAIYQGARRPR